VSGRICFDAFTTLANKHKFKPYFPAAEIPVDVLSTMFVGPA
jgi:hypothetical protein